MGAPSPIGAPPPMGAPPPQSLPPNSPMGMGGAPPMGAPSPIGAPPPMSAPPPQSLPPNAPMGVGGAPPMGAPPPPMTSRETPSQYQAAVATAAPPAVDSTGTPAGVKASTVTRWSPGGAVAEPAATAPATAVLAVAHAAPVSANAPAPTPPPTDNERRNMPAGAVPPPAPETPGAAAGTWVRQPRLPRSSRLVAEPPIPSREAPSQYQAAVATAAPQAAGSTDAPPARAKASSIKRWTPGAEGMAQRSGAGGASTPAATFPPIDDERRGSSPGLQSSLYDPATPAPQSPIAAAADNAGTDNSNNGEQKEIVSRLQKSNEQLKDAIMAAKEREASLERRLAALEKMANEPKP